MATSYDLCSHSYLILCRSCPKLVLYSGIQAHKVVEACNKCWRWGYGCGGPSILCLLGRQSTVRWCKVTYLTYGEIWITFVGLGLSTSLTPFSQDLCLIASWLVHGQRAVSLYPLPPWLSTQHDVLFKSLVYKTKRSDESSLTYLTLFLTSQDVRFLQYCLNFRCVINKYWALV